MVDPVRGDDNSRAVDGAAVDQLELFEDIPQGPVVVYCCRAVVVECLLHLEAQQLDSDPVVVKAMEL